MMASIIPIAMNERNTVVASGGGRLRYIIVFGGDGEGRVQNQRLK
jgi:hypothetical protein